MIDALKQKNSFKGKESSLAPSSQNKGFNFDAVKAIKEQLYKGGQKHFEATEIFK